MNNKARLMYLGDKYKYSHKDLYDKGIEKVFTNGVPRALRFMSTHDNKVVAFGAQITSKLLKDIADDFFGMTLGQLETEITSHYNETVFGSKLIAGEDWVNLWNLGYLPVKIKAVKDGSLVDPQTPVLHVENTDPRFFWLGQYLETFISQTYWPLMTSATRSRELRYIIDTFADETSDETAHAWRLHDFGCRGHVGTDASCLMGVGHLLYAGGTDTTIAERFIKEIYDDYQSAPVVNASEHSVMCSYGEENEEELLVRLLDEYKDTLLSIVIDGFDQDNFVYNLIPKYKETIQARQIPLVLRPDSGDMVETLTKYIVSLDKTFGHTVNSKGYKIVNNVALIWGDGCTNENIIETLSAFKVYGYALDNVLFGVGSFYYQGTTRDTLNFAIKATAIVKDGQIFNTMKKVKSDKSKASLSGLSYVDHQGNVVQNLQNWQDLDELDSRVTYFDNTLVNKKPTWKQGEMNVKN